MERKIRIAEKKFDAQLADYKAKMVVVPAPVAPVVNIVIQSSTRDTEQLLNTFIQEARQISAQLRRSRDELTAALRQYAPLIRAYVEGHIGAELSYVHSIKAPLTQELQNIHHEFDQGVAVDAGNGKHLKLAC